MILAATWRVRDCLWRRCGLHTGCQDFVYEHATGTCILLPHAASKADLVRLPNPNVISGSLQITLVTAEQQTHGACSFKPASSFTGGELGVVKLLSSAGLKARARARAERRHPNAPVSPQEGCTGRGGTLHV